MLLGFARSWKMMMMIIIIVKIIIKIIIIIIKMLKNFFDILKISSFDAQI